MPAKAPRRKIQAEDFAELELPSSPSISPDGRFVVFVVKKADAGENCNVSHLFIADVETGAPRALTRGARLDSAPVWSPDGRAIAFVSQRDDQAQIWLLPMGGGEPSPVTRLEGGPIRQLAFSPDGRKILFGHRVQPRKDKDREKKQATYKHITRLHHKLDGEGHLPEGRWHLWTVAVASGKVQQLTSGDWDDELGVFGPDGRRIAFVSNRTGDDRDFDNTDIYLLDAPLGEPRKLTRGYGMARYPAWSRSGETLYYAGWSGARGEWNRHPQHVYRLSLTTGRVQDLTPSLDRWIENSVLSDLNNAPYPSAVLAPYDVAGEERLLIGVSERGACQLYSIPAEGGEPRIELGGEVNVLAASLSRSREEAAVVVSRLMDAGDLEMISLDGSGRSRRLTALNERFLGSLNLSQPKERTFKSGKTEVQGWVLEPPGFRRDRKHPMLIEVHGGPMAQYGYAFFHEMHLLAAQGYIVVFTNPRGSDGYGTRFRSTIEGRWGSVDFEDVMAVADAMVKDRSVDRSRLGILGGSYGGFMTTWAVSHSKRFKAAVTQRQLGNMLTHVGTSDYGYAWYHHFDALPFEKPLTYLRRSPNFYAKNIETPLLIIHSEQDYRCSIEQAQELFVYLKMLGRTVELVQFEGESHGLSRGGKPLNRIERLSRIVGWFERFL